MLQEVELLKIMTCMLMYKHGVQTFFKVEIGNKLLIIIILEKNMQELVMYTIQQKINFYPHNHMLLGH